MSTATRPGTVARETKRTPRMAVKLLGEEGAFTARFATFNVVDRDGDVTLPGAFTSGQRVKIAAWGHNWGQLPVGQGTVRADSHAAYVDGHFFTDTAHGRDTYLTVKRLSEAGLQEWSYGFEVLDSEHGRHEGQAVRFLKRLNVFEVSPVLVGAGIETRTEEIKGAKSTGARAALDLVSATAHLTMARLRVRETLAAVRAADTPQEVTVLKGVIEDKGAGRWLLPTGSPDAFTDEEVPRLRAELRQAVQQAIAYREDAMRAQLQLQPAYLLALSGHGHPSTMGRDRADYEAAERARVVADREEAEARKALSAFEREVQRRALVAEHAAIAQRDAERAARREAARRGAERGLVARVLARGQDARQPVTFGGRPYKH